MMLEHQLGTPQGLAQEAVLHALASRLSAADTGLLGHFSAQNPSWNQFEEKFVELYLQHSAAHQAASKLAFVKERTFTSSGRQQRVALSLAALNAAQPIQLSVQDWKVIVEEPEDED